MKKLRLLVGAVVISLSFALATPVTPVAGAAGATQAEVHAACSTSFLGLPTWFKYLQLDSECDIVGPKIPNSTDIDWGRATGYIALAVVEALLRISGLVAGGFIMYGGFRYITSQGNPEGAASARTTIINALIGLVIAITAAAIVSFIGQRLT